MPRHRLSRGLVFASLVLLHVVAWHLASVGPAAPRTGTTGPTVTTLRLLSPEPSRLRERPAPRMPFAPKRPAPLAPPVYTVAPVAPRSPVIALPAEATQPEAPQAAASSPRPLDLRLHLAPGIAARSDALLAPAGPAGAAVTGGGREINLGDGRRRIFTADGKCFDSYPSKSAQLDPFQPGMLRDLKMVKACD